MERELLLALVLAHLRTMKPRQRVAFLREAGRVLDGWTSGPVVVIRDNGVQAAREAAAAWFRAHLTELLA